MKLKMWQVDAFATKPFEGNPAAVVVLPAGGGWIDEGVMQKIAAENNLSETAFVVGGVGKGERWEIRWFTPTTEVDLCGHATLGAAHVIGTEVESGVGAIEFGTKSAGVLRVERDGDRWVMDFPARMGTRETDAAVMQRVSAALGVRAVDLWRARDLMVVAGSEEVVRELEVDAAKIAKLEAFAVMVTAPGNDCDFVSRFFAPRQGIAEDPVTGSAHCTLIPYWAGRLGKQQMVARQLSKRGGELWCEMRGERVGIGGRVVTYLRGEIDVPG